MPKLKYFMSADHAREVGNTVALSLRPAPGQHAVFSVYPRKPKGCPEHFVAVVECGPISIKCFGPDRFEAQYCDSKNSVTGTRASDWAEAIAQLASQLVLMRDGYQGGISTLRGQH